MGEVALCPDDQHTLMMDVETKRVFCVLCQWTPPNQEFWRQLLFRSAL